MSLKDVFHGAAATVFKVFDSLTYPGHYVSNEDPGWGDDSIDPTEPVKVIVNGLSQDQLKNSKFFTQIQPLDTVIMVLGKDLEGTEVKNSDFFKIEFDTGEKTFKIIDHETDPAGAVYVILLRESY